MTSPDSIRLSIPNQTLERCGLFELRADAAQCWVDTLPKANLGHTAHQLYDAIHELNKVRLLPQQRLDILEVLRKPIFYVTRSLEKHYLNQPLVLPEKPAKVAALADTLHQQLATGYTIVAVHTLALIPEETIENPKQLLATAIHRTITDYSINLVRHFQLYQPAPENCWHQLHQLYLLASQQQVLNSELTGSLYGDCTVVEAYKRALLLGSCKANQLLQSQFTNMLAMFTAWAKRIELDENGKGLLQVDLKLDRPPHYSDLDKPRNTLSMDTQALRMELEALTETADKLGIINIGELNVSRDFIEHLIRCWSQHETRQAKRLDTSNRIDVCIGLSATHHFISGEVSFDALLTQGGNSTFSMGEENPFLKTQNTTARQKDVWDSPYEANVGNLDVSLQTIQYGAKPAEDDQQNNHHEKYHRQRVDTINFSATGYCVAWPKEVPAQLKPGEIVGIREGRNQNWCIAAIRWVENTDNQTPRLGLELLCPSGTPYGGRILQKKGDSTQYVRVLVLPAMPHLKQPYTLLTPQVPFKPGQKVTLNQFGKEVSIQLQEQLNHRGNYCQFTFTKNQPLPTQKEQSEDLDSLWDNL